MRIAIAMLLLAVAGCAISTRLAEPPPAPTPAPRPAPAPGVLRLGPAATLPHRQVLPEEEAVSIAMRHARSQGLSVSQVKSAHLDGAGRWHIDLRGDRGRDKAKVLVDGWTGRVLQAKVRDDDRDWDDD